MAKKSKWEKYLMYAIPIIGLGALAYYFLTRPPTTAAVAPSPMVSPPESIGVPSGAPSYGGMPTTDPRSYLASLAEQQCGLSGESLILRSLRPQDCGLNSWSHTSTGANVWDSFVNTTVADCTFIAIQGVSYGGTNFSQMRVNAGASATGYAPLAFISGLVSQIYFFAQPLIAEQNTPLLVDIIAKAVATENVNLIGTVAEKRGVLINP